jgi:hypothetical protein
MLDVFSADKLKKAKKAPNLSLKMEGVLNDFFPNALVAHGLYRWFYNHFFKIWLRG